MNRLKVLVFALVAVGLWAAHLTMTTPALASKAVDEASRPLLAASGAVAQRIEQARSELQGAAVKLSANPVLYVKKVEAPNAERFNAVRAVALEALTDPSKTTTYFVLANDTGALMAQGSAEPAPPPEGFDVKGASAGGGDGVLLELNGAPCLFFSVPVLTAVGGEVKPAGFAMVGGPLWGSFANVDQLADAVAKDLNLSGLGLWMKGSLAGASGKKDALEKAFKAAKPGQTTVVEQGPAVMLGPVPLPLFTGNANALEIAARRDIPGTPFEVVALGTVRPFMETLANTQKMALFMLGGLLLAGLVFTLLISSGASEEDEDDAPPLPKKAPVSVAPEPKTRAEKVEPLPGGLIEPTGELPQAPEASPDDFMFPPAPAPAPVAQPPAAVTAQAPAHNESLARTAQMQTPFDGPADDPFAAAGPPPPAAPTMQAKAPPPMSLADDDFENQRTTAYPAHKMPNMNTATDAHQALDPFALASAGDSGADAPGGFNPDATRVAAIPPELLKASSRRDSGNTAQQPAYKSSAPTAPKIQSIAPVGGGTSDEEHHFQETFRDFLATRQKCGEGNDGMTYDKFAAKLRKNKEQLVAKYNCRTVRFQVYVKDGKAALKATPVKD
ncbi:MAG: hypothetical protein JNK82_44485 [Myxococcaceae bacterium]|nr:hypothetical protein [Myxococcaceae bacterium]